MYDSEFEKVKDQYVELQDVFKNFAAIAEAKSEEVTIIDSDEEQTFRTANGIQASSNAVNQDVKQEETAVEEVLRFELQESLMNAGELEQPKKMSKKARKLASRLTVAELKQLVRRPDVVEVEDVTSADPRLLVYLKSYRNTVPVPRHWCSKRHYLQGRRGTEKTPFKLPGRSGEMC